VASGDQYCRSATFKGTHDKFFSDAPRAHGTDKPR
jgi:hypothetical protein